MAKSHRAVVPFAMQRWGKAQHEVQGEDTDVHPWRGSPALQLLSWGRWQASNSGHIAGEQMVALLVWVVGEGEREREAQPKVRLWDEPQHRKLSPAWGLRDIVYVEFLMFGCNNTFTALIFNHPLLTVRCVYSWALLVSEFHTSFDVTFWFLCRPVMLILFRDAWLGAGTAPRAPTH